MGKTVATTAAAATEKETETATSTWTTQNSLRKGWRRNKVDGEKEKVLEDCTACTSKIVILLSCWMNTAVKTATLYLTEKYEYVFPYVHSAAISAVKSFQFFHLYQNMNDLKTKM